MGYMSSYGLLGTPHLISVQDFAFRGRPVSLLVAYAPAGSHLFRFSRRSLRLALQSTARSNEIHENYIHHANKKNPNEVDSPSRISIHRSDLSSTKLLSSQPIFFIKAVNLACLLETILSPCAWHTLLLAQALFLLA